jgi:hypothetical protein
MTLQELISMHPETYKEVFAAGETAGREREHRRVCAHLDQAEAQGAIPLAVRMIHDGLAVAEARPDYLAARLSWNAPDFSA